jgi:hypothetical protein
MQTIKDFQKFLAAVREATGIQDMTADDGGLLSVRVDDSYTVNLQFIEATARVLCFIEVAAIPAEAPARLYRELLAAGLFGQETAGGYFAIEDESGTLIYNYFFDGDGIESDPEEFVSALEKILQLCDLWADRVNVILSEEHVQTGMASGDLHL